MDLWYTRLAPFTIRNLLLEAIYIRSLSRKLSFRSPTFTRDTWLFHKSKTSCKSKNYPWQKSIRQFSSKSLLIKTLYNFLRTLCRSSIICIQNIKTMTEIDGKSCPWYYSFELKTHSRSFQLFAVSPEERDLWVNGFNRLLSIPVIDPNFVPMGVITKSHMTIHE